MKLLSFVTVVAFITSLSIPETIIQDYKNGQTKYKVGIESGMFNGQYTDWYENGQKKTEGTFKNNQRHGTWSVWDPSGNLRMTREYKNNFQFDIIIAKNEKGENITLPIKTVYNLGKNQNGYIEYPEILEQDVVTSKRVWRSIELNETNKPLFTNDRLFNIIYKNITESKTLSAYDPTTDEFKNVLPISNLKSKVLESTYEVIGYKIKEDWFFHSNRQMAETRIIGLCPIIKYEGNDQVVELVWIYYPELRNQLALEQADIEGAIHIQTLEDVFHFRYFSSTIYKESNVYNRVISAYKSGNELCKEAQRIEIAILDLEHNLWIKQTENTADTTKCPYK